MSTYVIVEVSVFDTEEYEEYKKIAEQSLAPYNGKFIVRGGETVTLEGDWHPERVVVIEFPSKELALAWWHSDLYARAKDISTRTALTKLIVVEGV